MNSNTPSNNQLYELLEDYHDQPNEYYFGCPFLWKNKNWEYCECGLKEVHTQITKLINTAYVKGYNTGWQKSKRQRPEIKLPHLINSIETALTEAKKMEAQLKDTTKEED